jgi:hypothetical protein
MIATLIRWSARNVFLIGLATIFVTLAGIYAVSRVPLDAIPDLSDVQVIVYTGIMRIASRPTATSFAEGASDDDVGRSSLGRGRAKIIREDRNDDPDYSEGSVGPNQPPSGLALPLGNVLLDIPAQHHAIAQSGNDGVSSGSSVGQLLPHALDSKPSEFCVLIGTESHTTIVVQRCPLSEQGTCERVLTQGGMRVRDEPPASRASNIESAPETICTPG